MLKLTRTFPFKSATATAAACGLLCGAAVNAEQVLVVSQPPEFRQFDKVEITGSALRRPAETQALPVQIINRDDIRRSGLRSTSEIVQSLSIMGNISEAGQFLAGNGGLSNAAIHGMPNGTLVLVNGLRLSPFGRQSISGGERTGVDMDNIPVSAIDRIEVLTDGASSLYGTDALAGVVNIIMNEERKGVTVSLDNTRPAGGAAQTQTFALTAAGGSLARSGYTWRAELEHSERESLMGSDRPSLSQGFLPTMVDGQQLNALYFLSSIFTSPATLLGNNFTRLWNPLWSPLQAQGQGCPAGWVTARSGVCLSNPYPGLSLYPSQNKTALHLRGEMLGEQGKKYYADFLWGTNTQKATTFFEPTTRLVDPTNKEAAPYLAQAGFDGPTAVHWRPDIANPIIDYKHTTWRASAGMSGVAEDWLYQAQAYWSESRSLWSYSRQLPVGLLGAAGTLPVTDGWFNPQSKLGLNAQLEKAITSFAIDEGKTSIVGATLSAQKQLWELPGGFSQVALGGEVRRESSQYKNSNAELPQPDFDLKRHVGAAFVELRTPWQDGLESTASVRADRYDQFDTVNAKLSALWKVSPAWQLRGSMGSGFRAPQTAQLNEQRYLLRFAQLPSYDYCPTSIAASLGATCKGQSTIDAYTSGGNLKPEISHQLTLGVRHDISARASLSADFWRVAMKNEIGQEPELSVLLSPQDHAGNFIRDANGYLALYTPLRNVASSLKKGVDFDARWRLPLDNGRLSLQAQMTQYLKSWRDDGGGRQSDLARISSLTFKPTPKYMVRTLLAYNAANWSAGAIWNYRSSYEDLQLPMLPSVRVQAFSTVDLVGQYSPTQHIEIRAGLYNAANKLPRPGINGPSILIGGLDTGFTNLWGRSLRVGATYRF